MTVVDELPDQEQRLAKSPPVDPPDDDEGEDDDGDGGGDERDGGEGPWVTVATFWQPPPAHIARARLEAEGIDCVILDENLIATDWLFANAVGGIKLQVRASDAAAAVRLLEGRPPSDAAAVEAAGEPLFDGQTRCPRCGSGEVYPVRLARRLVFLSVLLLGAPLPIFARRSRCASCGFEWR